MANKNNSNGTLAAELLAAAAAAGTGYYYFYASDNAKKHRKLAAKWASAMRKEVVKQAKKVQAASPKAFATIVDAAAASYATAKNVRPEDVRKAASELKKNWDKVRLEFDKGAKSAKRKAKKATKRTPR